MPQDRKDSSAADTTKNTLAELLPGPDPTPPPKTPTPTGKNGSSNNNGNNNSNGTNTTPTNNGGNAGNNNSNNNNNNGGGGGGNNCRGVGSSMMLQNPFDDSPQSHPRPSPVMMHSPMQMRPGHPQGSPHLPPGAMYMPPASPGHMGPQGHPHPHPHSHPHGPHGQCGGMHPSMMHGGPGGKMYPPNQPMIFNASNPNAPPIYPCGVCHKEVHENDQAILCESGCNFWFHRMCVGLSEDAFHMLKSEVYAEWVCDRCFSTRNVALVKFKP